MGPLAAVLISGGSALFLVVVFLIEKRRGVRYGEPIRAVLDRIVLLVSRSIRAKIPHVNQSFVLELLHFIAHHTLSAAIALLRSLERLMLHVVRFNRMQVLKLRKRESLNRKSKNAHLAEIAAHKEASGLSVYEKRRRKEVALNG